MTTNADNLYARDGFWWWIGVVEDRQDPLKLGRCRVRVMGYHGSGEVLPIEDLPWAMPMTPILSAAISGKGEAPLGPLEGTWVVGFFADGAECQQPIMMGTMGGFPTTSNTCTARQQQSQNINNVLKDNKGNVITDANGVALPNNSLPVQPEDTESLSIYATLPPLNQPEIQKLMDALGERESSSVVGGVQNYSVVNDLGYVGKYQFGAAALQTQGYIRSSIPKTTPVNSDLENSANWTGKNGINSLDDFKANKNNVQEIVMYENIKFNYTELKRLKVIDSTASTKADVAGYLAAAHIGGAGGAKQLSDGVNRTDELGTGTRDYFNLGVAALDGTADLPVQVAALSSVTSSKNPITDTFNSFAGVLNNPKLGRPDSYGDPNSVYPRCEYTARADTNKLATRNDNLDTTPVPQKETVRIKNIPTANDKHGKWEEPPSAYNARYPYNHVKETESGHVIELDDTPNAERIHIYHRTGTYVEIDRNGSVRTRVRGENYEVYNRNNQVYVQGNADVTVDGSKTLLVKNTLDVEVLGKTTINIKDHADVNISGDLNLKARNITMEAQQSFNVKSGTKMVQTVGTDLDITVQSDENHRVYGDFAVDASDIFLNSGFGAPSLTGGSGLLNGLKSSFFGSVLSGSALTGINPLNADIANPLSVVGKGLSSVLGTGLTGGALVGNAPVLGGLVLGGAATGGAGTGLSGLTNLFKGLGGGGTNLLGNFGLTGSGGLSSNSLGGLLGNFGLTAGTGALSTTPTLGGLVLAGATSGNPTGLGSLGAIISGTGNSNLIAGLTSGTGGLSDLLSGSGLTSTKNWTSLLGNYGLSDNTAINQFFSLGSVTTPTLGGLNLPGASTGGTGTGLAGLADIIRAGAGIFTAGGLGGLISNVGIPGLNTITENSGVGSILPILKTAGLANAFELSDTIYNADLKTINGILSSNGLSSLEKILSDAGLNIPDTAAGLGISQNNMYAALKQSGYVAAPDIEAGENLIKAFEQNGASRYSAELPKLIPNVTVVDEFKDWSFVPEATQLSKYFTVGDLTSRVQEVQYQTPLMSQGGQNKSVTTYNLKTLAVNTLDPIKAKYADAYVSHAFKPTANYLISIEPTNPIARLIDSIKTNVSPAAAQGVERELSSIGPAQRGQEATLQFKGITAAEYYNRAIWIRDNVAYDQLRLEYTTLGDREPFIVVSNKTLGNRDRTAADKVLTVVNGRVIANFLVDVTSLNT